MKQIYNMLLTLVLLMAAQLAGAQAKVEGTLTNDGHTMKWSVSGIKVTKKGQPKLEKVNFGGTNEGNLKQEIEGTVSRGATIIADMKKVSGKNKPKIYINFDYYRKGSGFPVHAGTPIQLVERESMNKSFVVPSDADEVLVSIIYRTPNPKPRAYALEMKVVFSLKVNASAPAPTPAPAPAEPDIDCSCSPRIDSHIRFNDWYGQVMYRCYHKDDDDFEMADRDAVLYECDLIKTCDDSGCILGLEDMSTYVMKEESMLVINTDNTEVSKFEMLVGAMWSNVKKMAEGKSLEVEMSQCVLGTTDYDLSEEAKRIVIKYKINPALFGSLDPDLTDEPFLIPASYTIDPATNANSAANDNIVYACEVRNGVGRAYVFKGTVTLRNMNNRTYKLKAGQSGSIERNGKIVVKKFDVNKMAKKFGITNADLRGFRKPTLSTTNTITAAKRYEVERAIVKYTVTQGNHKGQLAKAFDNGGRLERREMKMGNQNTLQLTQGITTYDLDRKTKTYKVLTNAELNFLDMNAPAMKKLNLQKKGTATVLNRQCTVYKGQDVEFYVWKGIVLKKVQRSGSTIITTEATSVELPATIDADYFRMPKGYKKK